MILPAGQIDIKGFKWMTSTQGLPDIQLAYQVSYHQLFNVGSPASQTSTDSRRLGKYIGTQPDNTPHKEKYSQIGIKVKLIFDNKSSNQSIVYRIWQFTSLHGATRAILVLGRLNTRTCVNHSIMGCCVRTGQIDFSQSITLRLFCIKKNSENNDRLLNNFAWAIEWICAIFANVMFASFIINWWMCILHAQFTIFVAITSPISWLIPVRVVRSILGCFIIKLARRLPPS